MKNWIEFFYYFTFTKLQNDGLREASEREGGLELEGDFFTFESKLSHSSVEQQSATFCRTGLPDFSWYVMYQINTKCTIWS
jgi:hypothetical protein